jgi:hypothetical protein
LGTGCLPARTVSLPRLTSQLQHGLIDHQVEIQFVDRTVRESKSREEHGPACAMGVVAVPLGADV